MKEGREEEGRECVILTMKEGREGGGEGVCYSYNEGGEGGRRGGSVLFLQ